MNKFVIDAENQVGSTPVMIAAVHGRVKCVQRLSDLKADLEVMDVSDHILKEIKNKLDHISYPRATAALLCLNLLPIPRHCFVDLFNCSSFTFYLFIQVFAQTSGFRSSLLRYCYRILSHFKACPKTDIPLSYQYGPFVVLT